MIPLSEFSGLIRSALISRAIDKFLEQPSRQHQPRIPRHKHGSHSIPHTFMVCPEITENGNISYTGFCCRSSARKAIELGKVLYQGKIQDWLPTGEIWTYDQYLAEMRKHRR